MDLKDEQSMYFCQIYKDSGFLFSVQPPSVVLPSDRVGILSELHKALAELRVGNMIM